MNGTKKIAIFSVVMISVLSLTGCDALLPKSKKVEKPVVKTTAPVAAVDAVKKEATAAVEAPLPAGVVAKVGEWTLTKEEFINRLTAITAAVKDFDPKNQDAKASVLDELIRQQLLVYEARQMKLNESNEFKTAVKDFENTLLVQDVAGRLTKDVVATEEDVKQFYNANPKVFTEPAKKALREIVTLSQTEAKDVLVQILQGADFAQLAKEKSKAKTAEKSGDLGLVSEAPFEAMQKAVENLKKGDVSTVFEGPEGFYLVKVEDVQGGTLRPFDDIKEELLRLMTMQKQQEALMAKMDEVAKKIKVQVNAELLKD
jgi:peptidyl-prolyl cis-trans isomerase C